MPRARAASIVIHIVILAISAAIALAVPNNVGAMAGLIGCIAGPVYLLVVPSAIALASVGRTDFVELACARVE